MEGNGYIFLAHPEWNKGNGEFATDIRRNWNGLSMFQVGVVPWHGKQAAAIRLGGLEKLSSVYVFVKDSSGIRPFDAENGLVLAASAKTRYVTLFVTDDPNLARHLPLVFGMSNPYPNPCRLSAKLQYTLPYRWQSDGMLITKDYRVKVMVYDLNGRVVRTLVDRMQKPGMYNVVWDGKSNSGRLSGAGHYMVRIEAGDLRTTRQLVMVR
jgi:hypothetical protein